MSGDLARLDRVLEQLDPSDAVWLADQLDPPWRRRARRLARRNELICEAAARFFPAKPTVSARHLAEALARYAAAGWRHECNLTELPEDASARHRALHAILHAGGGEPLGWRQIVSIMAETTDETF